MKNCGPNCKSDIEKLRAELKDDMTRMEARIDARFERVDARFDRVDDRFERLEDKVDRLLRGSR